MYQKLEAIENQSMKNQEAIYYAEATIRIEKKLLEVMQWWRLPMAVYWNKKPRFPAGLWVCLQIESLQHQPDEAEREGRG